MRGNRNLLRNLCVVLACAVLMLALILVAAVCGGMTAEEPPEETLYQFVPSMPSVPVDPSEWLSGLTMPPIDPETREPSTMDETWEFPTWDPGIDTREPETSFGTAPDWVTLPPEPSTDTEPEWPTLPPEWDTLPEEWDTLPPDWGDVTLPDDGSIADILAGMNGSLQNPAGALGAGIASQLTVLKLLATDDDVLYLKMQSFGDYTGQGWAEAPTYGMLLDNSLYSADYLPSRGIRASELGRPQYGLWIDPVMQVQVIPYYAEATDGPIGTSDVLASVGLGDAVRRAYLYRHYDVVLPAAMDAETRLYEETYRRYVYKTYGAISDAETSRYIAQIIENEGFSAEDSQIIDKVAAYVMQAAKYNLSYDTRLDSEENIALAFLGGYREGVCRHFATAATLIYRQLGIPARYVVGFRAQVSGGATVLWTSDQGPTFTGGTWTDVKGADAHAWVEVYRDGVGWCYVEVTPPPEEDTRIVLELSPENVSRVYIPDTPLEPSDNIKGFEKYTALGYTYQVSVYGARTEPGVNESMIQFIRIFDPEGTDVTSYFNIRLLPGRVQVFRAELTFASSSTEQSYDGQALTLSAEDCYLVEGAFPDDGYEYRVEILPTGEQLHAGTSLATFRVVIWQIEPAEGDGYVATAVDVTDEFRIRRAYGTLTVTPVAITIKLANQSKVYDGTPLQAVAEFTEEPVLMSSDYIAELEVDGSQTRVGRSESSITHIVIRNEAGEDVTRNYRITLSPGTLTVTSAG